jgi:3-phosphoshikimate 1-carboxyvinyltransferase
MHSVSRRSSLSGTVTVPGSKSHTIRAVLLGAMAEGTSVIHNPLASHDCLSAAKAARMFGAETGLAEGVWTVKGTGGRLSLPDDVIDCGNSGTTAVFVMSMAALCEGYTVITGDSQIRRRPVIQLVNALNGLGAEAFLTRPGKEAPPVIIKGVLKGGEARFSGFNSQVVSSVLLSAALAREDTVILVEKPLEKPYLHMTIDWMKRYGVMLKEQAPDCTRFAVKKGGAYRAAESVIPGDWSAAAFPLVAAVCTPSELVIAGLDFTDAQGDKTVVDHLINMGADITKDSEAGTLTVRGGKPLRGGTTINLDDIPDSLPALSVAACFAEGETHFTGLAHARVKETDRVAVMENALAKIGAKASSTPGSMTVCGGAALHGTEAESHGDHRIAMALAVAGLFCDGEMRVKDAECASVSFPNFFETMSGAGASIELRA